MNMAEVENWKHHLGQTLPNGLWPTFAKQSIKVNAAPDGSTWVSVDLKQAPMPSNTIFGGGVVKAYYTGTKVRLFNPERDYSDVKPATIKLSEAIRQGSIGMHQARGVWGDGIAQGCAMTAALKAVGRSYDNTGYNEHWQASWPNVPTNIVRRVMEMNDGSELSFHAIADWVESAGY